MLVTEVTCPVRSSNTLAENYSISFVFLETSRLRKEADLVFVANVPDDIDMSSKYDQILHAKANFLHDTEMKRAFSKHVCSRTSKYT